MKKSYFLLFALLSCRQQSAPKIDIWGDTTIGYSVRALHPNGKEFYKWSDLASDTTAMRANALTWHKNQSE